MRARKSKVDFWIKWPISKEINYWEIIYHLSFIVICSPRIVCSLTAYSMSPTLFGVKSIFHSDICHITENHVYCTLWAILFNSVDKTWFIASCVLGLFPIQSWSIIIFYRVVLYEGYFTLEVVWEAMIGGNID